uniref:RdRp n=1 Tax=viral metagenome TaxID=1070528 RepID=A0A2V0RMF3_9ZZZZ
MDESIRVKGLFTKVVSEIAKVKKVVRKPRNPKGTKVSMDSKLEATILISSKSKKLRKKSPDYSKRPICVNRLTGLSDKKGKTRVVCIANIILQSFLKPVHEHLFHLLRNLETDGTHDQEAQAQRVRRATKLGKFCESIDMKSCTDRFPALFQCWALSSLGILSWAQALLWYISLCCTPILY